MTGAVTFLLQYRFASPRGEYVVIVDRGSLKRLSEYIREKKRDMKRWGWTIVAKDKLSATFQSFDTAIEYRIIESAGVGAEGEGA